MSKEYIMKRLPVENKTSYVQKTKPGEKRKYTNQILLLKIKSN